jgi:hypothetical protein
VLGWATLTAGLLAGGGLASALLYPAYLPAAAFGPHAFATGPQPVPPPLCPLPAANPVVHNASLWAATPSALAWTPAEIAVWARLPASQRPTWPLPPPTTRSPINNTGSARQRSWWPTDVARVVLAGASVHSLAARVHAARGLHDTQRTLAAMRAARTLLARPCDPASWAARAPLRLLRAAARAARNGGGGGGGWGGRLPSHEAYELPRPGQCGPACLEPLAQPPSGGPRAWARKVRTGLGAGAVASASVREGLGGLATAACVASARREPQPASRPWPATHIVIDMHRTSRLTWRRPRRDWAVSVCASPPRSWLEQLQVIGCLAPRG